MPEASELSNVAIEQVESAMALDSLKDEVANLKSRLAYALADYDNFKKRAEKDKAAACDAFVEKFACVVFDAVDNLDKVCCSKHENTDPAFISGVKLVLDGVLAGLKKYGFEKISCKAGDKFDVAVHEAMLSEESSLPANSVTKMFCCGWTHSGKLVRPAKVAVSR